MPTTGPCLCDARHSASPTVRFPANGQDPPRHAPAPARALRVPCPRGRVRDGGRGRLGDDGSRAAKPGQMVAEDVAVAVDERPRFVSRGGIKLANALAATGVDPAGRRCLDVGASTGGFTDCLLQHGAAHVVALDVAYGELDWRLRTDDRVTVIERDERARRCGRATCRTRRTSSWRTCRSSRWRRSCPRSSRCCAPRFDALAMVKPQFEVGRERVGKGGVVREAADRRGGAGRGGRGRAARSARPCSASRRPGCRGRRATARRSCGSPRAAAPAPSTTSTPRPPRWRPVSRAGQDGHGRQPHAHGAGRAGADGADGRRPRRGRDAALRRRRDRQARPDAGRRARRSTRRSPTTSSCASSSAATARSCARCGATPARACPSSR